MRPASEAVRVIINLVDARPYSIDPTLIEQLFAEQFGLHVSSAEVRGLAEHLVKTGVKGADELLKRSLFHAELERELPAPVANARRGRL